MLHSIPRPEPILVVKSNTNHKQNIIDCGPSYLFIAITKMNERNADIVLIAAWCVYRSQIK